MSPYKANASVLGIGVADIARTWGAIYTLSEDDSLILVSFKLAEAEYNCGKAEMH